MGKRSILHLEDDDAVARLVEVALQELCMSIEYCRVPSVERALQYLTKTEGYEDATEPGLILLDLHLPKRDGFEFLSLLRQSTFFNRVQLVVLSSSAEPKDRSKALELGAGTFVRKPATFDGYVKVMKRLAGMIGESAQAIHKPTASTARVR